MAPSPDRQRRRRGGARWDGRVLVVVGAIAVLWGLIGALGSALGWWAKLAYDYGEHF